MNTSQELLKWPNASPVEFWHLLIIMAVFFGIVGLIFVYQKRRITRNKVWFLIREYIKKRGLNTQEILILRSFYNSLLVSEAESIIFDPLKFYRALYKWFSLNDNIGSDIEIRILHKLFSKFFNQGPVSSPSNLRAGEACSLEMADGSHYLAKIMSLKNNELILSVPDLLRGEHAGFAHNSAISINIFRPAHGLFKLHGTLNHRWKDGISFLYSGKISHQGLKHYMSVIELECELFPWPRIESKIKPIDSKPDSESSSTARNSKKSTSDQNDDNENDAKEPPLEKISGITLKISDRALIFESRDDVQVKWLKNIKLWEIVLILPDGFQLKCKGKLIPVQLTSNKLLFKYIDISDNSKKILFSMIKENNPVKEKLL